MSYNNDVIKLKMSSKSASIYKLILLVGIIGGIICGIMFGVVSKWEPDMKEVSFDFNSSDDKKTYELDAKEGQTIFYSVESDNEIDVRIVTDYDGGSFNEESYDYTNDAELIKYEVESDEVHTILIDYGDIPAKGTFHYALAVDKSKQKTVWAAGIGISILGGAFIALIFAGIADARHK
jgi:hypothetical protein